jgi:hypothetical protein
VLQYTTIVTTKNHEKKKREVRLCFIEYSLSGHRNMIMKVNPDILKAKHLRIWYDAGGRLSNNQITTTGPAFEGLKRKFNLLGILFLNSSSMENNRTN